MGDSKPLHEIDDTKASASEDRFEEIVKRVKSSGAEITRDETYPLYTDIGTQEFEIGEERVVEFNMNYFDFKITRTVKNARITGSGHHKSLQELSVPQIFIQLRRKSETEHDWVVVDLDEVG